MTAMATIEETLKSDDPRGLRLELAEDSHGDVRWTLFDGLGKPQASGRVGYATEQAALQGLQTIMTNIGLVLSHLNRVFVKTYDPVKEQAEVRQWR